MRPMIPNTNAALKPQVKSRQDKIELSHFGVNRDTNHWFPRPAKYKYQRTNRVPMENDKTAIKLRESRTRNFRHSSRAWTARSRCSSDDLWSSPGRQPTARLAKRLEYGRKSHGRRRGQARRAGCPLTTTV